MPDEQNDQDKEVKEVQEEVIASETPAEELPEDVNERTKLQFEKLKQHNKELAEENENLKSRVQSQPSALESLVPNQMAAAIAPELSNQQVEDIAKDLVDENGFLDEALLRNTLTSANREVLQARKEAAEARKIASEAVNQVNKFGQDREVRIAHKKFPSVDPESSKYDPNFYRLVKNELLNSMYEGKKITFVDACREIQKVYSPPKDLQNVKVKAVEEYKETVAQKSALNPTGSSRPAQSSSREELIEGTRKGDAASIAARLENI